MRSETKWCEDPEMDRRIIEARVHDIADACLSGREVEDDLVELKAEWPEHSHRAARQIAAHANASRGEPLLWVVGLNERNRSVEDVGGVEVSNWWSQIQSV